MNHLSDSAVRNMVSDIEMVQAEMIGKAVDIILRRPDRGLIDPATNLPVSVVAPGWTWGDLYVARMLAGLDPLTGEQEKQP